MDHDLSSIYENETDPKEGELDKGYRLKSLILLLIILIPFLISVYELLVLNFSNGWLNTIQPQLPQMNSVITF